MSYNPGEVAELFGEADARELLRLASTDLTTRLATLRTSLATDDRAAGARAAHSMAGVSGNVMAMTLADLARELEGALRGETGAPLAVLAERVTGECDAVIRTIASHLAGSHA